MRLRCSVAGPDSHPREVAVCIVGVGPRGLSLVERLCANAADCGVRSVVRVHVVDPYPPGAGRVWRPTQAPDLLMNTVTSQVTVFTDASVRMQGPVVPGPSLYEWSRRLLESPPPGTDERLLAEAWTLGPDSYPTRAFYGHYLEWAFRWVVQNAPAEIAVTVHSARAVALETGPDGRQSVTLDDGVRLDGLAAVVLTQGHVSVEPSPAEERLATFARAHRLVYRPPANPAEVDLAEIRPGEAVGLRGLGLNFFDYMALLTAGRGGRFTGPPGALTYQPSGQEPVLYAGSRRGVPYHARGENEKGPHGRHVPMLLTPSTVAALSQRAVLEGGLQFTRDLWPLIAREVETVYYTTLLRAAGRDRTASWLGDRYLDCPAGEAMAALLDRAGIPAEQRWDWDRLTTPYAGRRFTGPADFRDWLLDYLLADARHARAGNVRGPLKAALDVLRDLRNEVRLLVEHGGLAARSHQQELDRWYTPLNAFLSIGPPVRRVDEMIALIEAGVLHVLGPGTRLTTESGRPGFVLSASAVPDSAVLVRTLIEARLPETNLHRTADPLLRRLFAEGRCAAYRVGAPGADGYQTGGLAVSRRPNHLLDAAGRPHPRVFAFGVPTESVHWVTAAGARPGVDSVSLADADAIARTVLQLSTSPTADPPTGAEPVPEAELAETAGV